MDYYAEEQYAAPEYVIIAGSFTTKVSLNDKARVNNICLASDAINNTIIYPGGVFSFNEATGPTIKKNGYEKAKIFVKGVEKEGYGGGICQVSSTLFNAAEIAGLEIVERHLHSKDVSYVEKGRDATVSFGAADLKIKNNYEFPLIISSFLEEATLTVNIEIL